MFSGLDAGTSFLYWRGLYRNLFAWRRRCIPRLFSALTSFPNVRYAEQGEFSKRAIINGKTDLVKQRLLMI